MNEPESFDFTVVITDNEERSRSGIAGAASAPRLAAGAKLLALWSLLFGLVVGVPFVHFMFLVGDDFGAGAVVICGLLFACAHTAASAVSFKRYKRKYDVFAPQFVFLCALPMLGLGVVSFLTAMSIGGWGGVHFGIIALCYGGYSVVYGTLLSVVLGIMYARGKNR